MNLTKEDVSEKLIMAVDEYMISLAFYMAVSEGINEIKSDVLTNHIALYNDLDVELGVTDVVKRITDPAMVYLSSDKESLKAYIKMCDSKSRKEGLKTDVMPLEHCPSFVAENKVINAKKEILNAAAEILFDFSGKELSRRLVNLGVDKYDEFINLCCKIVVNSKTLFT